MIELAPRSKNEMTYAEAVMYCVFLDYNGHTDWRLPTRAEYFLDANILIENEISWYSDDFFEFNLLRWLKSSDNNLPAEYLTVVPVRDV